MTLLLSANQRFVLKTHKKAKILNKGPESAGIRGFGRQMSRSTTEENGENGTEEPESVSSGDIENGTKR